MYMFMNMLYSYVHIIQIVNTVIVYIVQPLHLALKKTPFSCLKSQNFQPKENKN